MEGGPWSSITGFLRRRGGQDTKTETQQEEAL